MGMSFLKTQESKESDGTDTGMISKSIFYDYATKIYKKRRRLVFNENTIDERCCV